MTRQSWDSTWEQVSEVIGQRSQCSRRKVGAVIVDSTNRLIASGYNGPAAGYFRSIYANGCENFCDRAKNGDTDVAYLSCPSLHAEQNCLLQTDRLERQNSTMFVNSAMCLNCAKLVSNSGITMVKHKVGTDDEHRMPTLVEAFLRDCGLTVLRFT